jgi:hypothetical protein
MDFSLVIIGIVMFIALIGMVVCSKKQKVNPNAQPVAIALLIVVVICGFMMMQKTGVFGGDAGAELFTKIENQYTASMGNALGKFIAKEYPDQKILVIGEKNYAKDPRVEILTKSIAEAMGGKADIQVDTVELPPPPAPKPAKPGTPAAAVPPPDAGMDMPLAETMTARDFDNTLQKYPNCTVVVTTIGLPRDKTKLKFWKMEAAKRPKMIVYGEMDPRSLKDAIKGDVVAAFIGTNPEFKYTEDMPPSDLQKAFDLRFVLVNKANLAKYGTLFN